MNNNKNKKPTLTLNEDLSTLNKLIGALNKKPEIAFTATGSTALKTQDKDPFGDFQNRLLYQDGGYAQSTTQTYDLSVLTQTSKIQQPFTENLAQALALACINPKANLPQVDSVYHALLPGKITVFSSPPALMVMDLLTNPGERFQKLYGPKVSWLKQTPGFPLIKAFSEQSFADDIGAVFVHQMGLFVFGPDSQTIQDLITDLISQAEKTLESPLITPCGEPEQDAPDIAMRAKIAELRKNISKTPGKPLFIRLLTNKTLLSIANNPDLTEILSAGPLTVHQERVFKNGFLNAETLHESQPNDNVLLIPKLGLLVSGRSARDLAQNGLAACTILQNVVSAWGTGELDTQTIKSTSVATLPKSDYEDLSGQVSLVTGATSSSGRTLIESLLERGTAVIGLDENPRVELLFDSPAYLGLICDITDLAALRAALESAVRTFGGLDIAILNPPGELTERSPDERGITSWQSEMHKSLDANLNLLHETLPLLKLSPEKSRVIINLIPSGARPSDNPAYLEALAGLAQLARSAAAPLIAKGICYCVVSPQSFGSPAPSENNGVKIEINGCTVNDILDNLVEIL